MLLFLYCILNGKYTFLLYHSSRYADNTIAYFCGYYHKHYLSQMKTVWKIAVAQHKGRPPYAFSANPSLYNICSLNLLIIRSNKNYCRQKTRNPDFFLWIQKDLHHLQLIFSGIVLLPLRDTYDTIIEQRNYFVGKEYVNSMRWTNPSSYIWKFYILKSLVISMPLSLSGKKSAQQMPASRQFLHPEGGTFQMCSFQS